MLLTEAKIGTEIELESKEPFKGRLLIVEHRGFRSLGLDLPKQVKITIHKSRKAENEQEQ